jgi:hypothetical protein
MRHPKESVIRLPERGRGGVGLCDSAWEGGDGILSVGENNQFVADKRREVIP